MDKDGYGSELSRILIMAGKLILLTLFLGCEKPVNECKECTYFEDNKELTVFVCGEELQKFERDGFKCVEKPCKQ